MSGRLDSIAEWLKNNTEHFSEYNYVRVNPTDTDGYFGASSFDILWNLSSVNYGWIMLRSDNQKSVIFGRLVSGNAEWDIPAFKSDLDKGQFIVKVEENIQKVITSQGDIVRGTLPSKMKDCAYAAVGFSEVIDNELSIVVDGNSIIVSPKKSNNTVTINWFQFN